MIYLLLAILSSCIISVAMRLSNNYIKNNMIMFASNYVICAVLSLVFLVVDGAKSIFPESGETIPGIAFTLFLGAISGVLYLVSFMLMQFNIKNNGVVLSATFMKLGVIVPVVMSIILGWDKPDPLQIGGCVLAVLAIIIINGEGEKSGGSKPMVMWLILLLVTGGFTDSLANIFEKLGPQTLKNQYLLLIFVFATITSIIVAIIKKQTFTVMDALWGVIIGVPNYFSARFLLYSLSELPAIVVYPIFNISAILIISLLGVIFFKESLSKRKLVGMAVILVSILLLNRS